MKPYLFILFSVIILKTFIRPTIEFVVTYHDKNTIGNYYHLLHDHAQGRFNNMFNDRRYFYDYCEELRNSSEYRSANTEEIPRPTTPPTPNSWMTSEKRMEEMRRLKPTKRMVLHVEKLTQLQTLPTFPCLDFDGEWRFFITSAFIPSSSFLFTLDYRYRDISSREINGRGMKTRPKLRAIIDEMAMYPPIQLNYNSTDNFVNSLQLRETPTSRDSLCDLNRILKFRLCAIVSDFLQTNRLPGGYIQPYWTRHLRGSDIYHQPATLEESCPSIRMDDLDLTHKMLRCSVYIQQLQNRYTFYLSLNSRANDTLFSVLINEIDGLTLTTIDMIKIPLVMYLPRYKEALFNSNI